MADAAQKRTFTRTVVIYSKGEHDFVAKMMRSMGFPYLLIKIGTSVQLLGCKVPPPRSWLVEIHKEGSYRLVDRENIVYVVVSSDGVEVQQDRWPRLCFETVDLRARFCEMTVGSSELQSEIKFGVGKGYVAPYTEESDAGGDQHVVLPGLKLIRISGGVKEFREKLKEDRDTHDRIIVEGIRSIGGTRCTARAFGIRFDRMQRLDNELDEPARPPTPRRNDAPAFTPTPSFVMAVPDAQRANGSPPLPALEIRESRKHAAQPRHDDVRSTATPPSAPRSQSDPMEVLLQEMERLQYDTPDLSGYIMTLPNRVGSYDRLFGTVQIAPTQLPAYKLNDASREYERVGDALVSSVNLVVCGHQAIILPGAAA
uniref:Non-structural protein NS2 n=1 Tax=Bukakata virus TaxID=2547355 RepID=A0A482A5J0_9REOV|nr:NS2 [Bukakata virus]